MLRYVERCLMAYRAGGSRLEYCRCVLSEAEQNARGKKGLVRRGTQALFELSKQHGRDRFIPIDDIRSHSGIRKNQTPTAGLWPWLDKQADVIEQEKGLRAYRINTEFYEAMEHLFTDSSLLPNGNDDLNNESSLISDEDILAQVRALDLTNQLRLLEQLAALVRKQIGEPTATLAPAAPVSGITFRELVALLANLTRPDEDFADDLEAIQTSQPKASMPEWPN